MLGTRTVRNAQTGVFREFVHRADMQTPSPVVQVEFVFKRSHRRRQINIGVARENAQTQRQFVGRFDGDGGRIVNHRQFGIDAVIRADPILGIFNRQTERNVYAETDGDTVVDFVLRKEIRNFGRDVDVGRIAFAAARKIFTRHIRMQLNDGNSRLHTRSAQRHACGVVCQRGIIVADDAAARVRSAQTGNAEIIQLPTCGVGGSGGANTCQRQSNNFRSGLSHRLYPWFPFCKGR